MEKYQTVSLMTASSIREDLSEPIYEQLISESIDDVFYSLGNECRCAIYAHLKKEHNLKKSDIAYHPKEFSEALEQMFGKAAALLEIQIIRILHRKVPEFKYRPKGTLTLPGYVTALSHFTHK